MNTPEPKMVNVLLKVPSGVHSLAKLLPASTGKHVHDLYIDAIRVFAATRIKAGAKGTATVEASESIEAEVSRLVQLAHEVQSEFVTPRRKPTPRASS